MPWFSRKSPVNSSEWTPVPARNSIQNQNKSNKHTNVNSAQTIRTANRFSLLFNLEVDSMILRGPYEQREPSPLQTALIIITLALKYRR